MADFITTLQPNVDIINITTEFTTIEFTTLGTQGMVGAKGEKGDKLLYSDLSLLEKQEIASLVKQQKLELRGDVEDTSVNYANIFYDSLLS